MMLPADVMIGFFQTVCLSLVLVAFSFSSANLMFVVGTDGMHMHRSLHDCYKDHNKVTNFHGTVAFALAYCQHMTVSCSVAVAK